jgi:putative endonuclease
MTYSNTYTTYITSNPNRTTFYTGVTNNIHRRLLEHYDNRGKKETFAGRYYCYELVYYENYFTINEAIDREKELKDLSRVLKLELIKTMNPRLNKLII